MPEDLLLLPGLLLDERLWSSQVAGLEEQARIAIPDLTLDDSLEAMAARTLAAAPPQFALAGLSMGGYVALEILRQAPERVTRLALLDSQAGPDSPETAARRRGLLELADKGRFRGVTEQLLPLILHPDHLEDGALTGLVMEMAEGVGREGFKRQQTAILHRRDYRPLLASILQPTLVLYGEADALTPPALHRDMAIAIQTATLVRIEQAGHLPPLEQPEATTAALGQWLRRQA